jgi:hypothetical protein
MGGGGRQGPGLSATRSVCSCGQAGEGLLDGGGRRLPRCSPAPQDGRTPLISASLSGNVEVVEALLAMGADVEAKDIVSIARA